MKKAAICVVFFLLTAITLFAQDQCGIGKAIDNFSKIPNPTFDDYALVWKVVINNENMKQPFYYCDEDIDLYPGIDFVNSYITFLLSVGKPNSDPAIRFARQVVGEMRDAIHNIDTHDSQ